MELNQILNRPELLKPQESAQAKNGTKGAGFQDMLLDAINEVNELQNESDTKIKSLIKGESEDLHGTVLAVRQADTSFRMMMQVRNRIIEAYKEISRTGM